MDAMKNKSFQEFSDFQRKVDNNVSQYCLNVNMTVAGSNHSLNRLD